MNGLSGLTESQLEENLDRAIATRSARAKMRRQLKTGQISAHQVLVGLRQKRDPIVDGMKVHYFLASLPGISNSNADTLMGRFGIAPNRRLRGLGSVQLTALLIELGPENDSA